MMWTQVPQIMIYKQNGLEILLFSKLNNSNLQDSNKNLVMYVVFSSGL